MARVEWCVTMHVFAMLGRCDVRCMSSNRTLNEVLYVDIPVFKESGSLD